MRSQRKTRGIPLHERPEISDIVDLLPAVGTSHLKPTKIEITMPYEDALAHLKSRIYPLVNKLRDSRRNGNSRDITDWWFPVVMKEDQVFSSFAGKNNHNAADESDKIECPSIASNLGLTTEDFDILTKPK